MSVFCIYVLQVALVDNSSPQLDHANDHQLPHLPEIEFEFSSSDSEEDQSSAFEACQSTAVKKAVSSILQWSAKFRVSDAGASELFSLLHTSFSVVDSDNQTHNSSSSLPNTLEKAVATMNPGKQPKISELLVCLKCHSVYGDWHGVQISHCTHVAAPQHVHQSRRGSCGAALFQQGSVRRPIMVFPYISLIESLHAFLSRPGFAKACRAIATQVHGTSGLLCDVHDGKVWLEFATVEGKPFLQESSPACLNLALQLNVDWFQPFKHTVYSVGAIYVSILNLPRDMRYKVNNTILVGVIPGPHEPSLHMNSFLAPFVAELLQLWNGIRLPSAVDANGIVLPLNIHAALLSVVCDLPGLAKVAGFLGHSARLGCSMCLKEFPTAEFGEKPDHSGFCRDEWPMRNAVTHRELANQHKKLLNRSQQQTFESQHGLRYSELVQLPYFEISRYCVVDPMHNLFEGTAHHFMKTILKSDLLTDDAMKIVEERALAIQPPSDVGRLPLKVASKFAGFKADQWRNWIIIFSEIALIGLIPQPYYNCWQKFVKACKLICSRAITPAIITEADELLKEFCKESCQLFGNLFCTLNMHKHLHLKQCMLDFGPIYGFWCFPFERFNGKLGSIHTNNKSIELQIARKFLRDQTVMSLPGEEQGQTRGSQTPPMPIQGISRNKYYQLLQLQNVLLPLSRFSFGIEYQDTEAIYHLADSKVTEAVLSRDEQDRLIQAYRILYGNVAVHFLPLHVNKYRRVSFCGQPLKGSTNGSVIAAQWPNSQLRVGRINYLFTHSIELNAGDSTVPVSLKHLFVKVNFYQQHPHCNHFSNPDIIVTYPDYDNDMGFCAILPLQRLRGICAHGTLSMQFCASDVEHTVVVSNVLPFNFTVL